MPTSSDVEELRLQQSALAGRAERDLEAFWASLDLSRPERTRDALLEFVPTLTTVYGGAAALVAADWYDDVRARERVPGRFAAVMAAPFAARFVQSRVRFGAAHLFTDAPSQMLPFLRGAVDEYARQPGRDTIAVSTERDPRATGWVRVTRGPSCDMCAFLAARGAVYRSEHQAAFATHSHCDCEAVPSWDPSAPSVPARVYQASPKTTRMSEDQRRAHNQRLRAGIEQWRAGQAT